MAEPRCSSAPTLAHYPILNRKSFWLAPCSDACLYACVPSPSPMQFCFPPGQHHCRSTGRLIVFSLYGPFNSRGQLCCGMRGKHVVADYELKTMIDDIETEDILAVYVVRAMLWANL